MPKSVSLPCNAPAKAIHLLSGVSGWGYPSGEKGIGVADRAAALRGRQDGGPRAEERRALRRLHPAGRRARLEFAFALRGQQIRYLAVQPRRTEKIKKIELVKGGDRTAPVVMAVTVEAPQ